MRTVVLSDNVFHPTSVKLREILQAKVDSQGPILATFEQAEDVLARHHVTLLVVVLSPDPEQALALCPKVRIAVAGAVLAVGQVSDSRLILRALHNGADHYLDEADLEAQMETVLARLQSREENFPAPTGRLFCALGASGGSGTSTLAVNLAALFARQEQRCALVDLKAGVGDLAALLDLKPTHTLADLCLNAKRMDRAMFESALVTHPSGVSLLAPPQQYDEIRLVTPAGVQQTLTLARRLFPYTVVDLEDCFHEEQVIGLRQADLILLVFRLEFTSLRNTRRILEYLPEMGIDSERIRLVINRYGQAKELPAGEAEEALGRKIAYFIPDDPKTINGANNTGIPVVLKNPSVKVSQSIAQMARQLTNWQAVKGLNGMSQRAGGFSSWRVSSR
jgi:pilus assembly protein CpaE